MSVVHPDTFQTGQFIDKGNNEWDYEINEDITVRRSKEVMLGGGKIGPLTYYARSPDDYRQVLIKSNFQNVELIAPTINNPELLNKFPHLHKRTNYPLFLFMKGNKPL